MGFNKRNINFEKILKRIETNSLKNLFAKCDCLIFEDQESSLFYDLYSEGKTQEEILTIINKQKNMEVKL